MKLKYSIHEDTFYIHGRVSKLSKHLVKHFTKEAETWGADSVEVDSPVDFVKAVLDRLTFPRLIEDGPSVNPPLFDYIAAETGFLIEDSIDNEADIPGATIVEC